MNLTPEQLRKFEILLEKCNAEELRARIYAKYLRANLVKDTKASVIDDFEMEVEFQVFCNDEEYCKSKNLEEGDYLLDSKMLGYHLWLKDDEGFEKNWIEHGWKYYEELKHLHFEYLMHCLCFHSDLQMEDLLMIDFVWIDVLFYAQFTDDKSFANNKRIC